MTPELTVLLAGLLSSIITGLGALYATRVNARKDALILLTEQIEKNSKEIDRLRADYNALWEQLQSERKAWEIERNQWHRELMHLRAENEVLRTTLEKHGITVPAVVNSAA